MLQYASMKTIDHHFKKLILVCVRSRENSACCSARGAEDFFDELKLAMATRDPNVRVVQTQCLGNCIDGLTVVIQPDNRWFGHVTSDDIAEIVRIAAT